MGVQLRTDSHIYSGDWVVLQQGQNFKVRTGNEETQSPSWPPDFGTDGKVCRPKFLFETSHARKLLRREGALKGKLSVGRSSRASLLLWRSSCSADRDWKFGRRRGLSPSWRTTQGRKGWSPAFRCFAKHFPCIHRNLSLPSRQFPTSLQLNLSSEVPFELLLELPFATSS